MIIVFLDEGGTGDTKEREGIQDDSQSFSVDWKIIPGKNRFPGMRRVVSYRNVEFCSLNNIQIEMCKKDVCVRLCACERVSASVKLSCHLSVFLGRIVSPWLWGPHTSCVSWHIVDAQYLLGD